MNTGLLGIEAGGYCWTHKTLLCWVQDIELNVVSQLDRRIL